MDQVTLARTRFGGLRKLARALGISASTVSSWDKYIPARHHADILKAAVDSGIPLTADELVNAKPEADAA